MALTFMTVFDADDPVVFHLKVRHRRFVKHADTQCLRRAVIGVHQTFPAAQEKGVGARQRKRAGQRWLEPDTMTFHPGQALLGTANGQARKVFVSLAVGHLHEIGEVFVFAVAVRQRPEWPIVHAAEIARVAGVSAAIGLRRSLQYQYPSAGFRSRHGRAQSSVSAANDDDIKIIGHAQSPVRKMATKPGLS